jgi:hypothetical protein
MARVVFAIGKAIAVSIVGKQHRVRNVGAFPIVSGEQEFVIRLVSKIG